MGLKAGDVTTSPKAKMRSVEQRPITGQSRTIGLRGQAEKRMH